MQQTALRAAADREDVSRHCGPADQGGASANRNSKSDCPCRSIGLGGIVGAYVQGKLEEAKRVRQQEHDLKKQRYATILVLMLTKLDPGDGLRKAKAIRPDLQNVSSVDSEIRAEAMNAFLFANDEVVAALAGFVQRPDYPNYRNVALSMRRDLWGKGTKLQDEVFTKIIPSAGPDK